MIFIESVVLKDVRMFVFPNSPVINLVSLPVYEYVKVVHFYLSFGGVFFHVRLSLCLSGNCYVILFSCVAFCGSYLHL
jgi:hypothetical protein